MSNVQAPGGEAPGSAGTLPPVSPELPCKLPPPKCLKQDFLKQTTLNINVPKLNLLKLRVKGQFATRKLSKAELDKALFEKLNILKQILLKLNLLNQRLLTLEVLKLNLLIYKNNASLLGRVLLE